MIATTLRGSWAPGALVFLLILACRPDDQRTETVNPEGAQTRAQLAPEVVAHLDSGSVAYREDRFEDALVHYTRVTELDPSVAAGWFGVYMVQHEMGNAAAADEALERAQAAAPGATLIHPSGTDTVP